MRVAIERNTYPKFLAFLQLSYPALFGEIVKYSSKAELVEAKLICANAPDDFHAVIFSDGLYAQGDRFKVQFKAHAAELLSWDWRWVFGLQIRYKDLSIFPLPLRQQVVALPSRDRPLSARFFATFNAEFATVINDWIAQSKRHNRKVSSSYHAYLHAMQTH
jgi:hypothetical protein